jgi:hypothetical protein
MGNKHVIKNRSTSEASSVRVDTLSFSGHLGPNDDTVYKALLALDSAGGLAGSTGAAGIQGETGLQGVTGLQGPAGADGSIGVDGETGAQGATGVMGVQGLKGDQGETGAQGETGIQGIQGETGIQGVAGTQGDQGATGAEGIAGVQGSTGVQGETGIQGETYKIEEWSSSKSYKTGETVFFRGSVFVSKEDRTSGSLFSSEMDKWDLVGSDKILVNQPGHSLSQLDPVYLNGTTWAIARADGSNTLATHVVIESGTGWVLLADKGVYEFTSHSLSNGIKYCSLDGSGYIESEPSSGYVNPCLYVIDPNTIEIRAHAPAVSVLVQDVGTREELLYKITVTDQQSLNENLLVDTDKYPFIVIKSNITYTGPTNSQNRIGMTINNDTSSSYGHTFEWGGRNSAAASFTGGGWAWNSDILVTNQGGFIKTGSSIIEIFCENNGSARPVFNTFAYTSSDYYAIRQDSTYFWTNTSDDITSIQIYSPNLSRYGTIYVYGRTE